MLHNRSYIYAYFFWILSPIKIKLAYCWRLETSSRFTLFHRTHLVAASAVSWFYFWIRKWWIIMSNRKIYVACQFKQMNRVYRTGFQVCVFSLDVQVLLLNLAIVYITKYSSRLEVFCQNRYFAETWIFISWDLILLKFDFLNLISLSNLKLILRLAHCTKNEVFHEGFLQ